MGIGLNVCRTLHLGDGELLVEPVNARQQQQLWYAGRQELLGQAAEPPLPVDPCKDYAHRAYDASQDKLVLVRSIRHVYTLVLPSGAGSCTR